MRVRHELGVGWLIVAVLSAACSAPARPDEEAPARGVAVAAGTARPASISAPSRPRIVVLGDSLTAGLGLSPDQAFPAVLQHLSDADGLEYDIVNAGVSGDTSAGGLRRLGWVLEGDVRILVVALGGNDGLRGVPAEELRRNLATIIERAQARDISVVLTGMEAPPNLGPAYTAAFREVYVDLTERYDVTFLPFLLDGVAGMASLNQRDGIHPNAEGAELVAELLWPVLRPVALERQADVSAAP
jgi:acyl-CoA thioesterase-1